MKLAEKRKRGNGRVHWETVCAVIALLLVALTLEFWIGIPQAWVLVLCVVFIIFGVAHEFTWIRRRRGGLVNGVVVGMVVDDSGEGFSYSPEIEYTFDDATRRLVSSYGGGRPMREGTPVKVWVSEDGDKAEWYSLQHRVLFTALPIIIGVLGLAAFLDWF